MESNVSIKFNIINPKTDKSKPAYTRSNNTFLFPVKKGYRYYLETSTVDNDTGLISYYLLLSKTIFDDNCRLCEVNGYGKCKIHPRGELKTYISRECEERGNITCDLIDANRMYDVYAIV